MQHSYAQVTDVCAVQSAATGPQEPGAYHFEATPEGTKFSAQAFSELQLSRPLLRACAALGYDQPTPIQARSGLLCCIA